jgi:hypothetical protein
MKTIFSRLQRLEQRFPPPAPASSGPSVAEQIAEGLARIGFERGERESLAETFARFLGVTPLELRTRLQWRAAGQPAEQLPIFAVNAVSHCILKTLPRHSSEKALEYLMRPLAHFQYGGEFFGGDPVLSDSCSGPRVWR